MLSNTSISRMYGYALVCLATVTLLWQTIPAVAQKASGPKAMPAALSSPAPDKFVPPSASHSKTGKSVKAATVKLYPTTPQETADAILADSLERIVEKADAHFHKGEFNHVINLNRIVVQGDPHNVEAYGNSALLLWSTDRNDQAIEFLKQGIQANPKTYYLYDEMGSHYWIHLKDPNTALPYYEKAVTFKCPWLTWHNLAHCYEKTNQWDKAVQAWESAARYTDDPIAAGRLERARQERDKHKG